MVLIWNTAIKWASGPHAAIQILWSYLWKSKQLSCLIEGDQEPLKLRTTRSLWMAWFYPSQNWSRNMTTSERSSQMINIFQAHASWSKILRLSLNCRSPTPQSSECISTCRFLCRPCRVPCILPCIFPCIFPPRAWPPTAVNDPKLQGSTTIAIKEHWEP